MDDAVVSTAGWLLVTQDQLGGDRSAATLYYGNGALELSFDAQGVLAYIRASSGYKGSVFGDLTIGSRLVLIQKHLGLIFDDIDELFRPGSGQPVGGIVFFGEAASLDDEPEQLITGIAVHLN
ncbi:hypothetical protein RDV84_09940 [Lysobacter yananisis]|uniref:Uncharacterized protein n=1 Tax=Lysobacter yananisis TaxID=1003114 RepID=A0ABY9PGF0_9GAMM|nr:hypothetical protein [Lysobacter yananisis]WMT05140.1 hypothetical protein RDV84_09940 [Lysobacter yananisis]